MRIFFILAITLPVTGCYMASYNNAPPDAYYECKRDNSYQGYTASVSNYGGVGYTSIKTDWDMIDYCLKAKGYTVRQKRLWFWHPDFKFL